MTPREYADLRHEAILRAHVLRQEAVHAFWAALMRRLSRLAHRGA